MQRICARKFVFVVSCVHSGRYKTKQNKRSIINEKLCFVSGNEIDISSKSVSRFQLDKCIIKLSNHYFPPIISNTVHSLLNLSNLERCSTTRKNNQSSALVEVDRLQHRDILNRRQYKQLDLLLHNKLSRSCCP